MSAATQPWSRAISGATAAYAVFSLVRPQHLGKAMESDAWEQPAYDKLARAYGVRDLAVSTLGLAGSSPRAVRTAVGLRLAADVADAVVLSTKAPNARVRAKVLAVTLGWAALGVTALVKDRRRR